MASNSPYDVEFGAFDPDAELSVTRRKLPHWFQPGVAVFVTFRTKDSLPRKVIQLWQAELADWLQRHNLPIAAVQDFGLLKNLALPLQREFRRLRDRLWHRALDDCHGECVLREKENARIVGEAMRHFDGDRYDLDSFVVMPNHVHLLVQFRPGFDLATQATSWLHYSAFRINQRMGRKGKFWQPEPFDHLVRSAEQFEYLRSYVAENPTKATLRVGECLYWRAE